MYLIFWRHAEAEEGSAQLADLDRPLTARGHKQAARMGAWLDRQLPDGARILCSPAIRAEQTALALGRKHKLRAELAPGCTSAQLLELVQWPQGKGTVVIVGHQPTLGEVVAHLLGSREADTPVRKGAVWWLRCRERDGQQQAVVVAVQTPETL